MVLRIPAPPLLPLTCALMAGICYAQGVIHAGWLAVSACVLICILELPSHRRLLQAALGALCLVAGALGWYRTRSVVGAYHDASQQITLTPCSVEGSITALETREGRTMITLAVTTYQLASSSAWVPVVGNITLSTNKPFEYTVADQLRIGPLTLRAPQGTWSRYALRDGIIAQGNIGKKTMLTFIERPRSSIRRRMHQLREQLVQQLAHKMPPSSFALFATIFLGSRQSAVSKDVFAAWGLVHQLARSGLHLVLFVMILKWLLMMLPLTLRIKQLILGSIVLFYAAVSWYSVSFARALITFFLYLIYEATQAQTNGLQLLCLAVWLVLLASPLQLFFLDFQLSFGLSAALVVCHMTRKQRTVALAHAA